MKTFLLPLLCLALPGVALKAETVQTVTINGQKVEGQVMHITLNGDRASVTFNDQSEDSFPINAINISFDSQASVEVGSTDILRNDEGTMYDLCGRKLSDSQIKKGVYIVNGKKQIVR